MRSSLSDQYDDFAKAADRKVLDVQMAELLKKQKEKEESKNQYSSGCDDEYNACEYSDAYDFYYWNEDFFIDFEEAEEYWEKYH